MNRARAPLAAHLAGPLLIVGLAGLFLGRALFTGEVLLPGRYLAHFAPWQSQVAGGAEHWNALAWDAMAQYYPWRAFAHESLARGVIPLWNPHQFCGMPFIANGQSAVLYPLNLVFYLMDPARAFAVSAALHLALAGIFSYMLLRALGRGRFGSTLGGITFAFCAFIAAWLQLPTVLDTAVWLPLALFFVARYGAARRAGYLIGLGLTVGTALLAGHPQVFLYVAGAAAAYFVVVALSCGNWRTRALALAGGVGAAGLAVLGAAVQLLPTAELFPLSHRATAAGALGYDAYLRFAIPWQHLVTLVLPEFMGNPVYGTYWGRGNFAEYAAFVGALPLALAVIGVAWKRDRDSIFFAALAVFALLVALGTPLNRLLFYHVPGFAATGGPQRMLFVYSFAVAMLAGMGADAAAGALAQQGTARRFARALSLTAAALVVIAGALVVAIAAAHRLPISQLLVAPAANLVVVTVALGGAVGMAWAAARNPQRRVAALGVLMAAGALELFAFGAAYYRTAPRDAIYPPTALTAYLGEREDARIMPLYQTWGLVEFPRAVLPPNAALAYGLYDVQGYDSLYLARYRQVMAAVEGRDPSPAANGNMLLGATPDPGLLKVLGVRYVVSPTPLEAPHGLTLERAGEVSVYRVENPLPRAYMASSVAQASGLVEALAQLDQAAAGGVILEAAPVLPAAPIARGEMVRLAGDINRLRLEASRPGWMVVSDAYYPGWRAWVEGRPAAIHLANGAFRAVEVRPGERTVEMRYEPTSFRLGLFATLGAIAVAMGAAGAAVRRPRR